MSRNTLSSLMRILKSSELEEVEAFFQNEKEEYQRCFQYLGQHYPLKKESQYSNEHLFAAAYPGEPYNDQKLRHLKSGICRLLEDYLVLGELKTDEKSRQELLIRALAKRPDYNLFKNTITKRIQKLDSGKQRGKAYFQEKAHHYQWLYLHPETEPLNPEMDYLRHYIEHLERFFTLTSLELATESILLHRNIQTVTSPLLSDAATYIAEEQAEVSAVFRLFLALFYVYSKRRPFDAPTLKAQLEDCLPQMDDIERRMALKFILSFPIQEANWGKGTYEAFIFDLYKQSVDAQLLIGLNGTINPGHFINIIIIGAKTGHFNWAEKALATHITYIPDNERITVKNFCLASIYYQKGLKTKRPADFKYALDLLDVSPKRSHEKYNIRHRSLLIRILYELFLMKQAEMDEIDKQVNNFKSYLRNNKRLSAVLKNAYDHFLDYFKTLCRLLLDPDKKATDVAAWKQQIQVNGTTIALKDWLLEKAEEL
ncbi:MAG TPA: hypothetical protein PKA00_11420 [Saprospiraceae bacterium]|nr:hypothetical protein [Saprospiraceae bacterium]HMQ83512.1 hypothetical protein [Saprospiraceae bacterium]